MVEGATWSVRATIQSHAGPPMVFGYGGSLYMAVEKIKKFVARSAT